MQRPKRQEGTNTFLAPSAIKSYNKILSAAITSANVPEKKYLIGCFRARQYEKLLIWAEQVSPQKYDSHRTYFDSVQLAALIKKYPFSTREIPGLKDPEKVALGKFAKAENRCKRMNAICYGKRRRHYFENPYHIYMARARKFIKRALGETPNMDDIFDECDFTAGASVNVHGNKTNLARKLGADGWTGTRSVLP